MTFQEFWKKTKKAVAIQVETIKNIPNSDSDLSSPLNSAEYIDATRKLKRVANLINRTISNFQQLNKYIVSFNAAQRACSQTFSNEISNMVEVENNKNKSISFEQSILKIVEEINDNKDLAFLYSKLPEVHRLNQIHEKLYNNLLLKKRAEDKASNAVQKGTTEQRQVISAEYDKRSEKSSKYQNELDEGIERLSIDVLASLKSLDVFYRAEIQKFITLTSKEFVSETVPVEAFMGSNSSDDEKGPNKKDTKDDSDNPKKSNEDSDDQKRSDDDSDNQKRSDDDSDNQKRSDDSD